MCDGLLGALLDTDMYGASLAPLGVWISFCCPGGTDICMALMEVISPSSCVPPGTAAWISWLPVIAMFTATVT